MSELIDLANDICEKADIVEVISHFLKVEKKGKDYLAICPFHNDHSLGSFRIAKEKGIYKCFACGEGGNAIKFVQKYLNLSFPEAVKKTAEIIGYDDERLNGLVKTTPIDPKTKEILNCLNDISAFYETSLFQAKDHDNALSYLHDRGLNDDVIKTFHIGYSQSKGENTINFLTAKGYSLQTISDAGILNLSNPPYRDINSNRISFPIFDKNNRIVGFSCRKFEEYDDSIAKYVNSSSTAVFEKSDLLYNYYYAALEAKKTNYIYVLEGFMDVIACYRVGIKSAVGLMGTALTKENLQTLKYLKVEIRLCLDRDNPGQINIFKIANQLDEAGVPYKIVNNDTDVDGKDCDEILKNCGEEKLRAYLTSLISKGDWLFNYYSLNLDLSLLDNKKIFLKKMIPFIANLEDPFDIEDYTNRLISRTGFSKDSIDSAIKSYKKKNSASTNDSNEVTPKNVELSIPKRDKVVSRLNLAERQFVKYMLESKDAIDFYEQNICFLSDENYRNVVNCIKEYIYIFKDKKEISPKEIVSFLSSDECTIESKNKAIDCISEIELDDFEIPPYSEKEANEILETIKLERSKNRLNQSLLETKSEKSAIDAANLAKAAIEKKKQLLAENDKKRR